MLDIVPEGPEDGPEIELLLDRCFGPDRRAKVSYRYRPGVAPLAELCLVARDAADGRLVGSVRYWPVRLGGEAALLLGPLAIDPDRQGVGIGRALTRASLASAEAAGYHLVFLVGAPDYYARHGFRVVPPAIRVPDEEPGRVQYLALAGADLPPEGGELLRADGVSVAAVASGTIGPGRDGVRRGPGQPCAAADGGAVAPRTMRPRRPRTLRGAASAGA